MHKTRQRNLAWGVIGLVIITALAVQIIRKDYALNRTLRNINLRLVQIQQLSRTTATPFQVELRQNSYVIRVFNKTTDSWDNYLAAPYPKGVNCDSNPFVFLFSHGRLQEIQSKDKTIRVLRSVMLKFQTSHSRRTRTIIFHQKGEWRVLG